MLTFFAPTTTSSGVLLQNNNLNDRGINGISNYSGQYIYANGGTQRTGVGLGGVVAAIQAHI